MSKADISSAPVNRRRTGRLGRPRGTGTQTVYKRIRDDILRLRRRPGESLDESSLEKEFSVSRTPVREALIRLASENLVDLMPNRGARVAHLDINDIPQLFEALELIERVAYHWCALRRKDSHLEALRACNKAFRAAAAKGDYEEMGDANRRFHMIIGEGSGNSYLNRSYEALLNVSLRLATTLFAGAAMTDDEDAYFHLIIDQHEAIIDALERRDAEAAETLALSHTRLFRRRVIAYMEQSLAGEITISPDEPAHPEP